MTEKTDVKSAAKAAKSTFLQHLRVAETEPVEVEGAKVQAIGDTGYCTVRALRDAEAMKHRGEERMAAYAVAERAAYLSVGVVDPALPFAEWLHVLKTADTGKVENIIETIKRLSGIEDIEVALAKKALEQMQAHTES